MATYIRTVREDVEIDAPTAAEATVYFEVGTHEAQAVTVSKGGGAFGATGGSVASQVDGTIYKLVIHADDADTLGDVAFKCAGATDTQVILGVRVVSHNPFSDCAPGAIADAVLTESVSSNKATSGGLADVLNDMWRRLGFGLRTYDRSAGTIKTYDGDADSDTLLLTETRSEAGSETDWTPS